MNRVLFSVAALLGALMPLVFDSALKGAALLAVATLCALLLCRASAATRHLVWLVAIVALLVVPVLSVALPQWRVLPQWAVVRAQPVPPGEVRDRVVESDQTQEVGTVVVPPLPQTIPANLPPSVEPPGQPAFSAPPVTPDPPRTWRDWLAPAWAVGFAILALRLLAAHLLLRRAMRGCVVVAATPDRVDTGGLATQLHAACAQLGIRQRVTLLLNEKRTIPVVWGVFRPRLLLPAESLEWNGEQVRSVLLHELAHIKRRDTLVQWLTQIACALHWWNPLVWLAAWRLHAERERACDDLVLASGVRPSAYAEHLLHVATKLSPARWTAACGLAMARKSSLEGRLLAVLSEKLNRRGVTSALAAIALILGAGIAIPVAMLRAADETWKSPRGAHIGGNDFSAFCIHDGKDTSFVIAYHGDFDSSSRSYSNAKTRTWNNDVTLTAKKPGIALSFHRTHAAPGKLSITTAPSEPRNLGKLAPAPRDFGQKEYDLANGRVFLLTDAGTVRQLDLPTPVVTDQPSAKKLAALIAAVPPQVREDIVPTVAKPKHKDARELYEIWQHHARANGDIPGALVGELAAAVRQFIKYNPTYETVPQLNALLPRLDATRDWKSADIIALFDEMAELKSAPFDMASWNQRPIRKGDKLPEKFADAAWRGAPGGLRVAWMLEPAAAEYRIGTALSARLMVWNTGAVAVVLQVPTFHQGEVKATDAKGAEVNVSAVEFLTLSDTIPVRLGPGEFIEINTPGVGLGEHASNSPWAGARVGSSVLAKPGDELTLTHSPVPLDGSGGGIRDGVPPVVGAGWWLTYIKSQLARQLPLPAAAAERTHLLERTVRDLFSAAPTAEEIAAFIADQTPGALAALAKRLAERADAVEFAGSLPPAPIKIRVLAADSAAEEIPRVALGPGEYPLPSASPQRGDATLKIVGRPVGDRRTNDAQLIFEATEFTGARPPDPHKLELPDGWGTWAIVCRPGEGFFYLLHKGTVRKIDYSAPRKVTDTPANDLPAEFRDEAKRQLEAAGVSDAQQAEIFEKPAPPATTPEPKTGAVSPEPKNEYALAHFRSLQKYARENGDIPGGLIALLDRSLAFGLVPKLDALGKRLDATRDWTAKETAEFLDAAAATEDWTGDDGRLLALEKYDIAQNGKPLPPELASLPWGVADDSANGNAPKEKTGLRAAFTIEPAAASYAQGAVLPVTVHYHNSGTAPLVFPIGHSSSDMAEARDEQGRKIFGAWTFPNADTGRLLDGPGKQKHSVRLEPGHWISISGARLTIGDGRHADAADSHGVVLMPPPDSTVKLKWAPMTATWREPHKGPIEWKERVRLCVARFSPMPKSRADREDFIRRVTFALTGVEATAAEVAAFAADTAPDAVAKLTARFQSLPPLARYWGWLWTGEQTFKITPGPANYRGTVMTANGPGLYEVADSVFIQHYGPHANFEFTATPPEPRPRTVQLDDKEHRMAPHGWVWRHGSGVVWLAEKERVRKFDFTTPGKLKETELPAGIASIPEELRAELVKAFPAVVAAVTEAPATTPVPKTGQADKPQLPKLPDDAYAKPGVHEQKFREEDAKRPGGELMGAVLEPSKPEDRDKEPLVLGVRTASDAQWRIGGTAKVGLVVRNRTGGIGDEHSGRDVKFPYTHRLDNWLSVVAVDEAGNEHKPASPHFDGLLDFQHMLLPVAHVATIAEFTIRFDPEKRDVTEPHVAAFHLPPGKYKLRCKWNDARPEVAHEGEWTGELVNKELEFTLAAPAVPAAEKPKGAAAVKLTPDALLGFWRGTMNEEKLMLSFHRPPVERDVQLDIYFGEATIGVEAGFTIAADGGSAAVLQHSAGGGMKFGTLIPGGAGKLKLKLYGRQQGQMEVMLTLDAEPAATEPHQKEPRELFAMWKTTANEDGTIPGTFIGALATEVRAYVKAHSNLDSGMKLPKLLPRFVTSRDWTQAEAIKLLDDVAYYATEPIAARVAKAKLGSGPLWRTMVEFQDIPVAIAKWSEAKDGLRIGLRVVGGQWRAGGSVRVELWLHNEGGKDVSFYPSRPNRQDAGVAVAAIGADGREIPAETVSVLITEVLQHCTLPAGHVAMAKEFDVTFGKPDSGQKAGFGPRFPALPPGNYQLRCKWHAEHGTPKPGDWTGEITAPDHAFTMAAATAAAVDDAKPAPKLAKLPDDSYAKVGVEIRDLNPSEGSIEWSEEQNGLCVGLLVPDDRNWRIGGEVKVEMWVCNPGEKDVRFQHSGRRDIGLRVFLKGADGKEHAAAITQFLGKASAHPVLLPSGHVFKAKEFSVVFLPPGGKHEGAEPHFTLPAGGYKFRTELKLPGLTGAGADGKQRTPAEGEWTGTLKSGEMDVKLVAAADAPAAKPEQAKPANEHATVDIAEDGAISLDRKKVTLDELKAQAAMEAKKWFVIRADKDVPYAKVIEVMDALRKAHVVRISLKDGQAGDGKFRVASSTGSYKIDDQRTFSICKLASGPGYFTVHWRAKEGDPVSQWVRIHPVEPEGVRGTWAVAWEPGTDVLWWMDNADIGRMNFSDPKQVIVERSARVGARPPGFVPPDGVIELFESLGFFKGLWNRGTVGGDGNLSKRVMEATPAKASGGGKAQPEDAVDDVKDSHPAPPESPRADVKPVSKMLFNEDYAAKAVQSEKDVNFVLFYQGNLSSGISEWSSGAKWRFNGTVYLVDAAKTAIAGKNVNKRAIPVKYTSDAPTKLYLDGKECDLSPPRGRIFILRDEGEPIQTARTLPLRDAKDLAAIGEFAAQWLKDAAAKAADDSYPPVGVVVADIPVGNIEWCELQNGLCVGLLVPEDREWRINGEVKVELWVCNPGETDVKFHHNGRNDIGLRVFMKGADGKEHAAEIAQFRGYPVFTKHQLKAGHAFKAKAFTVQLGKPQNITANPWFDLPAGDYKFRCEVKIPGSTVSTAGKQIIPAEGEWSGTIKSSEVAVKLAAANAGADAAKPADKPRVEFADVALETDGTISLNRKKLTLDELNAQAAKDAKKWFVIGADKDVPYAKVVEVMNALRKAGVVRISLKDGQAGDGMVRVASSTGSYKIDDQRSFSICKLASGPGYFTVHWRAKAGDPVSQWVRISPVEPEGVRGTWAVAWEQGTDVLWWMDNADIGRMIFSDPKQVIVERSARVSARPPGFVPPDGVIELFESLGFFKGLWNRGTVGGDGNLSKRVMEATPAKASGDGKTQPEEHADDVEDSPPAPAPVPAVKDPAGANEKPQAPAKRANALVVRAQGEWSDEWQALSKVVAESLGLAEWKPDDVIAWGAEGDGLRSGMLIPRRVKLGDTVKPLLVLRNVSGATKELKVCTSLNVLTPSVRTADGKTAVEVLKINLRGADALFPVTLKAGEQLEFAGPPVLFGVGPGADGKPKFPDWPVAGVVTGADTVLLKFNLQNVRAPETGEVAIQVAAAGASIRGKLIKPDGSPAAGVSLRVDDGIERWKFRGEGIPDLPKTVKTADDGTFSIEVPKNSAATNYNVFADSDAFAPIHATVPAGGDVGVMQFANGSLVTGRVIGLDGAGLAKVGIWCKRLDWRGRGPAPTKLTSTGADGTFSIPPIATGRYLLQIITRDLGAQELTVAFANHVIEAKDDAPVAVNIRPLPTVDLTFDVRVRREKAEFPDFEVRVSGTLPGVKAGDPGAYWTRQETTKLTQGRHTIAAPAGLQNVQLRADRIYMRKGDDPAFIWQREGVEKREAAHLLELGVADKPQTIGLTVQDAAK